MFACVCWTPFQIVNAINYKLEYEPEADMDLFVCMKFSGAEAIAGRLAQSSLIHNVYLVKNLDYDSLPIPIRKVKIFTDLLNPGKIITEYVKGGFHPKDHNYSYVISSGYLNFNILFNNYYGKRGAEAYFFDDGVESYLGRNTADHYSAIYRVAARLTGNGGTNLRPRKLFVYVPQLVLEKQRYADVLPLPSLDRLPLEVKQELNLIFDYKDIGASYQYMLFDQLGTGDFKNRGMLDVQNRILSIMAGVIGAEKILIKLHPRITESIYPTDFRTFKSSVPWEVFALNEEIQKKVFVSISSTACLTPKLIFNMEPIVIFLYNLYPVKDYDDMKDFICRVKSAYTKPERVHIPDSMEELRDILMKIKEQDLDK